MPKARKYYGYPLCGNVKVVLAVKLSDLYHRFAHRFLNIRGRPEPNSRVETEVFLFG
jgi:hypothetical protein